MRRFILSLIAIMSSNVSLAGAPWSGLETQVLQGFLDCMTNRIQDLRNVDHKMIEELAHSRKILAKIEQKQEEKTPARKTIEKLAETYLKYWAAGTLIVVGRPLVPENLDPFTTTEEKIAYLHAHIQAVQEMRLEHRYEIENYEIPLRTNVEKSMQTGNVPKVSRRVFEVLSVNSQQESQRIRGSKSFSRSIPVRDCRRQARSAWEILVSRQQMR